MQTLVYIIGGYCVIKAVFVEIPLLLALPDADMGKIISASSTTAILFLAAIEAFNQ